MDENVRISSVSYTPGDYPIQPKRYSEVTLTDAFWKPKVATNARRHDSVRGAEARRNGKRVSGQRARSGDPVSLKTHPNPQLQAQVDARGSTDDRVAAQAGQQRLRGRGDATTTPPATRLARPGDQAPTRCTATSWRTTRRSPAASATRSTACSCTASTHDKKHLDLAKHYLDIRGLENSVNRSRHNQSYKPVLEQSEAVGHAVNCVSLMVSLADVGVLTGLKDYFDAAQRMWTDAVDAEDVHHRRRRHDRQRGLRRAVRRCRTSRPTRKRAPC